jgi:hypothetical protein
MCLRKVRYFYLSRCKKCNPVGDFLKQLKDTRYAIVEEYDLRDDPSEAQRYRIATFPAIVVTDANDNEKVFFVYQGKLSDSARKRIIEELKLEEEYV